MAILKIPHTHWMYLLLLSYTAASNTKLQFYLQSHENMQTNYSNWLMNVHVVYLANDPTLKDKWYFSEIIQLCFMSSLNFMTMAFGTSLNSLHNLYIFIDAVLYVYTLLLELVFHITLCVVVLCVKCCITLGTAVY